jgi:hypothetical protein
LAVPGAGAGAGGALEAAGSTTLVISGTGAPSTAPLTIVVATALVSAGSGALVSSAFLVSAETAVVLGGTGSASTRALSIAGAGYIPPPVYPTDTVDLTLRVSRADLTISVPSIDLVLPSGFYCALVLERPSVSIALVVNACDVVIS